MAELDHAAISIRLGQSLKAAGIKQYEMADLLHVHTSAIEQYVSPKYKTVPFDRLDEWARITGTTKEQLLHGDDARLATPAEVQALQETMAELAGDIAEILRLLHLLLLRETPEADSESG